MSRDLDREFEIAAVAAASERRNSPARLLLLAGALLVVCASFAGYARARAAATADDVARAQADARRIQALAGALERLDAASQEDWATQYEPFPLIRTTLEVLAARAGLEPAPTWSDPPNVALQDSPLTQQRVVAQLASADLQPFLDWITTAQQEIDGLEIVALDLTPLNVGWKIRCQFGRWERRQ